MTAQSKLTSMFKASKSVTPKINQILSEALEYEQNPFEHDGNNNGVVKLEAESPLQSNNASLQHLDLEEQQLSGAGEEDIDLDVTSRERVRKKPRVDMNEQLIRDNERLLLENERLVDENRELKAKLADYDDLKIKINAIRAIISPN